VDAPGARQALCQPATGNNARTRPARGTSGQATRRTAKPIKRSSAASLAMRPRRRA
jgi:hypothetical protein